MKIQPGMKIKCNDIEGTLGLLVQKKNDPDTVYLLTCWHVLDNGHADAIAGKSINVTAPDDGNRVIATYKRSDATANKGLDVALAKIKPSMVKHCSKEVLGSQPGKSLVKSTLPMPNMKLRMSGAASKKVTLCQVEKLQGKWGDLTEAVKLKHHPNEDRNSEYCKRGDSGSVWWSSETGGAVAVHTDGKFPNNRAAAVPVKVILRTLKLKIHVAQVAESA